MLSIRDPKGMQTTSVASTRERNCLAGPQSSGLIQILRYCDRVAVVLEQDRSVLAGGQRRCRRAWARSRRRRSS